MQFTHLKCKIHCFFGIYIHRVVQPSPQLILEHFYHSPNKNSEPLNYHLPMPALSPIPLGDH